MNQGGASGVYEGRPRGFVPAHRNPAPRGTSPASDGQLRGDGGQGAVHTADAVAAWRFFGAGRTAEGERESADVCCWCLISGLFFGAFFFVWVPTSAALVVVLSAVFLLSCWCFIAKSRVSCTAVVCMCVRVFVSLGCSELLSRCAPEVAAQTLYQVHAPCPLSQPLALPLSHPHRTRRNARTACSAPRRNRSYLAISGGTNSADPTRGSSGRRTSRAPAQASGRVNSEATAPASRKLLARRNSCALAALKQGVAATAAAAAASRSSWRGGRKQGVRRREACEPWLLLAGWRRTKSFDGGCRWAGSGAQETGGKRILDDVFFFPREGAIAMMSYCTFLRYDIDYDKDQKGVIAEPETEQDVQEAGLMKYLGADGSSP